MPIKSFSLAFTGTFILAAAGVSTAMAQTYSPVPEVAAPASQSRWGVGLGLNFKQKAYSGIGTTTTAIPLVSYENNWVRFAGPTVDLKLPASGPVSFALRARYAFEDGYESGDASILNGMNERKSSFWLGATTTWRNDIANLSAEWLGDASGHSKGQRIRLAIEKPISAGRFQIAPRLAVNWLDRKYIDYYYGVTAAEARAGRAAYSGRSAVNTELGLRTGYALAANQSLYLDLSATRLANAITDSPLVGRSTESALRIGYLYNFR